jgi:hypothetical protein
MLQSFPNRDTAGHCFVLVSRTEISLHELQESVLKMSKRKMILFSIWSSYFIALLVFVRILEAKKVEKERDQMIYLTVTNNGITHLEFHNGWNFITNADGSVDIEGYEYIPDDSRAIWDFYFSREQFEKQSVRTWINIGGKMKPYTECVIKGHKPNGNYSDYIFVGTGKSSLIKSSGK